MTKDKISNGVKIAVIETGAKQYKVSVGDKIKVSIIRHTWHMETCLDIQCSCSTLFATGLREFWKSAKLPLKYLILSR